MEELDVLKRTSDPAGGDLMRFLALDVIAFEPDLPPVAVKAPVIKLNKVVLPAPLGPMTALIAPSAIAKDTSLTACNPPNFLFNRETSSSGIGFISCWFARACKAEQFMDIASPVEA